VIEALRLSMCIDSCYVYRLLFVSLRKSGTFYNQFIFSTVQPELDSVGITHPVDCKVEINRDRNFTVG
jgi:hypothetical protein